MRVLFDTNIYISFIRDLRHSRDAAAWHNEVLFAVVLMELWLALGQSGLKSIVERLQRPYAGANRVISLTPSQYISIGKFLAGLPSRYRGMKESGQGSSTTSRLRLPLFVSEP